MLRQFSRAVLFAIGAAALAASAHAQQQNPACLAAVAEWKRFGEPGFAGALSPGLTEAYRYLMQAQWAAPVAGRCDQPFNEAKVSQAVRAAAADPAFCAALPQALDRVTRLQTNIQPKRPADASPVTRDEAVLLEINQPEALYWTNRFADIASNAACAEAVGLANRELTLSAFRRDVDFIMGRVRAAGQSCQASMQSLRTDAAAVAAKASDVAAASASREALRTKEAAARKACEPFGFQTLLGVDNTISDVDVALGQHVPACNAVIASARPPMTSAMQALQTRNTEGASKLVTVFEPIRVNADRDCKDYPGVGGRLLRMQNDMIALAGPARQ